MRFQKLEMIGFKSFVDKTGVSFQDGMTAVVGPNGCGKSNISDAIRWVLGEMSAKNLRGGSMEDVIFSGSDVRKPMGMAEVNLTLQDVDSAGKLGFTEFSSVTITRRLFRNGDSEYLINKIPCRLKDIRDLLMDTGVGSRAYSIIEQGKIGQIVASKPEERRFIIEEVAGITKYKTRKNEALSKLKETSGNLDRVNDIVSEVKRQINSLDRQAKKAERYKKLMSELRALELKFAWDDYNELMEKTAEADREFQALSSEEDAARNSVSAREAELSEMRLSLAEKERGLMEHQREIHRLEAEVSRLEARAEVAATQLEALDEREGRIAEERGGLVRQEAELEAQSSSLRQQHSQLKEELDRLQEDLRALEAAYQEKADRSAGLESSIEEERGRIFDIQARISHGNNQLARLEERKKELEHRALKAREEQDETVRRHRELRLACETKRMELAELGATLSGYEKERGELSSSVDGMKAGIRELGESLAAGREEYSSKNSRLQSLRELEEGLEGYGEGVKAVMAGKRAGSVQGVHGIVADVIRTRPEHERAVEAVLGERLQHVVVGGHADAREALELLKARGAGRSGFMPVSPRAGGPEGREAPSGEGVIGYASGLIQASAGYEAVAASLLGHVLVVRDLDTALSLWEGGVNDTVVTLDGEVLEPRGVIYGGAASQGGGILSKKREIRELGTGLKELAARNAAMEDRLAETRSELGVQEARLAELGASIHDRRISCVGMERELEALEAESARLSRKLEVIGIEAAQREAEMEETAGSFTRIRQELDALEEEKLAAQAKSDALGVELRSLRSELDVKREEMTARKVELSSLLQQHESSARDLKRADLHKEELAAKSARLDSEEAEIAARRGQLAEARHEAETGVNAHMTEALRKKDELPAFQDAYETASQAISGLEETVKLSRREAEAAGRALSELGLRRTELRLNVEHLAEKVRHDYHIAITEVEQDIRSMELDREEADMNASELRIKIERIGPVNVGAIEEYNELMERFEFLSSQKEDLEKSVRSLREAIGKINKTSEELFMEAFESINETFKKVFVSLFEGGRAELRLVTPESGDLLESGLDIVAQPPGKKLQSLTLFSGGEKALIAAALLFACFLVKPSPFCVMDEVDAPLDEANVQRFGKMIKEFADKTQFIVVTHSRTTMELADALYGVTMDEPGVSRLVSVRLKEAAQMAEV